MKRKQKKRAPPRKAAAEPPEVARSSVQPSLREACREVVSGLRPAKSKAPLAKVLSPGSVAPAIDVPTQKAQRLFQIAFAHASGATNSKQIVWVAGEHELLVNVSAVQMAVTDGFVLVNIPVYTQQTGNSSVVVPFAVGGANTPQGLIMATETVPRGPADIVEYWGESLIAAAWRALLDMTSGLAAAAGVDEQNQVLLPATFVAQGKGIRITPQARHRFDSGKP